MTLNFELHVAKFAYRTDPYMAAHYELPLLDLLCPLFSITMWPERNISFLLQVEIFCCLFFGPFRGYF